MPKSLTVRKQFGSDLVQIVSEAKSELCLVEYVLRIWRKNLIKFSFLLGISYSLSSPKNLDLCRYINLVPPP